MHSLGVWIERKLLVPINGQWFPKQNNLCFGGKALPSAGRMHLIMSESIGKLLCFDC